MFKKNMDPIFRGAVVTHHT